MRGAHTQGDWLHVLNEWGRMTPGAAFQRYTSAGVPTQRKRVIHKAAEDILPGQKRAVRELMSGGATGGIGGWVNLLEAFGQYTVGAAFQRSVDAMRTGNPEHIIRAEIPVARDENPWPAIPVRRRESGRGSAVSRAGA